MTTLFKRNITNNVDAGLKPFRGNTISFKAIYDVNTFYYIKIKLNAYKDYVVLFYVLSVQKQICWYILTPSSKGRESSKILKCLFRKNISLKRHSILRNKY